VIESVSFHGGPSVTIKSHHNVGGLPERMNMRLVEPLRELFKDEVRKLGNELDVEAGYNAAKRCALSIVAQVKKICNDDLEKVKSCIKLTGYVNSTNDFTDQPKVINGASDLIASVFGDAGMHTRAAVSVNSLPLGVAVEVDAIIELN